MQSVEEGAIGAWFSEAPSGSPSPEVVALRAHDSVVRTALRSATPLPVRFGTVYASEAALRASLRERESELRAALEKVNGRVEMGLRVEWKASEPAPSSTGAEGPVASGRGYLERRRAEIEVQAALLERASAVLDAVEARVASEGIPAVRTVLPAPGVAGLVAHLVHRHGVGEYRRRVEEVQAELTDVRLRVTGPWAPYSFV